MDLHRFERQHFGSWRKGFRSGKNTDEQHRDRSARIDTQMQAISNRNLLIVINDTQNNLQPEPYLQS